MVGFGHELGQGAWGERRVVDAAAVAATVVRAVEVYGTETYGAMSKKCISQDLTWAEPAMKWEAVLEEMNSFSAEATIKKESVSTPVVKV